MNGRHSQSHLGRSCVGQVSSQSQCFVNGIKTFSNTSYISAIILITWKYWMSSLQMQFYKLYRIFYPCSIGTISTDGSRKTWNSIHKLWDEWDVYITGAKAAENWICTCTGRQSITHQIPNLGKVAMDLIWTRTTSVDCERSFLQYNNLLTNRWEMLTRGMHQATLNAEI